MSSIHYSGTALHPEQDTILFVEHHTDVLMEDGTLSKSVEYHSPHDEIIARKSLTCPSDSSSPDFLMEDLRDGYQEGVHYERGAHRAFFRQSAQHETKQKRLNPSEPVVIDTGVNQFIQQNWDALVQGKVRKFNFIVPRRLDYFRFRLEKIDQSFLFNRSTVTFRAAPAQIVLRFLAAPIDVVYDLDTKQILQYLGISNMRNENDENLTVKIIYKY